MPATHNGSRYVRAQARSSGPPVIPASTKPTKRGQATVCSFTCGAAAKASSYAWELAVASVQITPTRPDRVAATARRAAGKITSTTGTVYRSRASRSTAALAEFQGILANASDRLFTVRRAGCIPQVDDVFIRQLIDDRAGHGESTESRVEDADRRFGVGRHGWSAYASRYRG